MDLSLRFADFQFVERAWKVAVAYEMENTAANLSELAKIVSKRLVSEFISIRNEHKNYQAQQQDIDSQFTVSENEGNEKKCIIDAELKWLERISRAFNRKCEVQAQDLLCAANENDTSKRSFEIADDLILVMLGNDCIQITGKAPWFNHPAIDAEAQAKHRFVREHCLVGSRASEDVLKLVELIRTHHRVVDGIFIIQAS